MGAMARVICVIVLLAVIVLLDPTEGSDSGAFIRRILTHSEFADLDDAGSSNSLLRAIGYSSTTAFGRGQRKLEACRKSGGSCGMTNRCCGNLKCYRKDGLTPKLKTGVCRECFEKRMKCQRTTQCCGDLICDKEKVLDMNGVCGAKRRSGTCFEDAQCQIFCRVRGVSDVYGRCH